MELIVSRTSNRLAEADSLQIAGDYFVQLRLRLPNLIFISDFMVDPQRTILQDDFDDLKDYV